MKRAIIVWLLNLSLKSSCFSQAETKFDTAFVNTSSAEYFQKNPAIKKIAIYIYGSQNRSLSIYPKTIWQANENESYSNRDNYESYNLGFSGDKYLLEKKYGLFQFPEKIIETLAKKACDNNFFMKGFITPDSIKLQLSYSCKTKSIDPEEIVFEKIEIVRDFIGGPAKLKKDLEEIVKTKNLSLSNDDSDSVLIYTAILNGKDSSMIRLELIEGNYSPFSQGVLDVLIKPKTWTPSIQGGRPVKSYLKIYIRLRKDNSIEVDY